MSNVTLPSDLKSIFSGFVSPTGALAGGISAGVLPQLAIDGRMFSLRRGGSEPPIQLQDNAGRIVSQVDVTIIAAHSGLQRVFYAGPYDPAAKDRQPDCRSRDGITPDPDVPNRQSDLCSTCVQAAWGSANRPNSNAQACRAFKPLIVVFSKDPACTFSGEPMVLRVPPASLQSLPILRQQLDAGGLPMWMRSVRVGFDFSVTYPKLVFSLLPDHLSLEAGVQVLRAAELAKEKIAATFGTPWELPEMPEIVRTMLDRTLEERPALKFEGPKKPEKPEEPEEPKKPSTAELKRPSQEELLDQIEQLFGDTDN